MNEKTIREIYTGKWRLDRLFHSKLCIPLFVVALLMSDSCVAADTDAARVKPVQQFVTVEANVRLEVLDWGGSGRPLVLLAGLGDDAHAFDKFAPKLAAKYHVYGITRRGFGASSAPESGYSSERLGEDVIAVLNELQLEQPVLVGHSIAGSELSYVGSIHSDRVAGLIYLDAAYGYAYYDGIPENFLMTLELDAQELQKKVDALINGLRPPDVQKLRQTNQELIILVQQFEKELHAQQEYLKIEGLPTPPPPSKEKTQIALETSARRVLEGTRKYTRIHAPILAIFASPRNPAEFSPLPKAAAESAAAQEKAHIDAFEKRVPSAHVVRIANASHNIFESNEAEVLREMDQFIAGLPPAAVETK